MDLYCIFIVVCVKRKVRFTKPFLVVVVVQVEEEAKRYVHKKWSTKSQNFSFYSAIILLS